MHGREYKRPTQNWLAYLWREWFLELRRPVPPPPAKPRPNEWLADRLTVSWLGHSTVLMNFYGVTILTDPVLFSHVGIRLPFITLGPKRLVQPALGVKELPPIDLILLSHAHFDHLDLRTLRCFDSSTQVLTAPRTADLLRSTRFRSISELRWGERKEIPTDKDPLVVRAFRVAHWGARVRRDVHRGYAGFVIERKGKRVIFAGDTAYTDSFAQLRDERPYDLGIFGIGAYQPWIRSHCTPEQAIKMADMAGALYIMPVHHQTFRLSGEPLREPTERFERALANQPERIALREIGETFVLPEPAKIATRSSL